MSTGQLHFEQTINGVTLSIREFLLKGRVAYRIVFSSPRKPLVIVRAKAFEATHFWTSVPEGRQREAEGIGPIIEAYIQNIT